MLYVVVGCGAIGGTIAAGLARDGHDVLVCDASADVVSAVRANGIRIEGPVENFTARVTAVGPSDLPERLDGPVLVAVKAHHTAAAADLVAGRLAGGGFVVSMQNGLNAGVLADAVGADRVVEACVNFGADAIAPGVILRGNRATLMIGETDGSVTERVRRLAADIADAQVTDTVLGYLWAKEAYGAMLTATAVSDLSIADALADPAYAPLMKELARQVLAQAPVKPVPLDGFDPDDLDGSLERLTEFNRRSAKTHSGIYRDLAVLHRPTEVPAILGALAGDDAPLIRRTIELIEAIEQGKRVCSRANLDLLAAYERMTRLGEPLNAVAAVIGAPDRAASGPLAGQPVAVKDIIAIAGVPTRCGSPVHDPAPAAADAVLVSRLRSAGAEVFAASQCLEYAAGFAHPRVGDTRNPADPSKTSGGSSGGSAALVAAGVCDLAIGTDTGGSIRIPAAYCGIVGLKPSYGLVPEDGVFPLSPRCDHVGTLTATVGGTADLLAVLAGQPDIALAARADDGAACTVGVLATQFADPSVTREVADALAAAIAALTAAGWGVRQVDAPWLGLLASWEQTLAVIVAREAHLVHAGREVAGYAEGTRALLEFGASVTDEQFAAALGEQAELTSAIEASLSGIDALIGPSVGYQAPEQDPPFGVGEESAEGRFTGPYNLSGHPALSLPVPVPPGSLPVGLQLAGRRDADAALLRVAAAAERVLAAAQ
ncbi:MAG TPA: amidase family protein [Streptosporangiaceae bacterium]|nr:amidase family protein [Streptosporangiaceae bacterium]